MKTTLNKLYNCGISRESLQRLLTYLGKTVVDDEPLSFCTILASNGVSDTGWCMRNTHGMERVGRLYTLWKIRQNKKLMNVECVMNYVAVMERGCNNKASREEMRIASYAFSAWATENSNFREKFIRDETDEYVEASEKEELLRIFDWLDRGLDPYPFIEPVNHNNL